VNANVTDTAKPRAGKRFQPTKELALHAPALRACVDLAAPRRDLNVVREMTGPYGIPDFTAIIGGRDTLDARLECPVPPLLNEVDAAIVAVAHANAARTVDALARAIGWPASTIARRVPHLVKCGGLIEVKPNLYVRPGSIKPHGSIIAVEAKVEDWRKALRQVRTYAVWADSYVVVMGDLTVRATQRMREEVERDKGGLMVGGDWVVRPRLESPQSRQKRVWAAEHVVAALRDSYQPSPSP
jgi:DNA-binding Lrp family transcriptional regulator